MTHNIKITSLTSSGEGVGSLNGLKVFVDGALVDEMVSVELTTKKKTYAKAKLHKILTPSHSRTKPVCPYFDACGGCQVMHLQYSAQLHLKQRRISDNLQRIGKIANPNVLPCLPSPSSIGYRNKIQLPIVWDHGKKTIGMYRKKSHEIVPIEKCLVQCSQGEEILALIRAHLTIPSVKYILIRNAIFNDEALVILVTNGLFQEKIRTFGKNLFQMHPLIKGVVQTVNKGNSNSILGTSFHPLAGRPYIIERLLNKQFKLSAGAFFQINSAQTEHLYTYALSNAFIQKNETVLDAYCGVGTLALFAADQARHVFGVECVAPAIKDAIENARLNKISNCTFICGHIENIIGQFNADVVLLNPPRKGCDHSLLQALIQKNPGKIVYISCDPATLARDLNVLSLNYKIEAVQPFDMFPQTMHVETVVHLKRNAATKT